MPIFFKVKIVIALKVIDLDSAIDEPVEFFDDRMEFLNEVRMVTDPKIENITNQKKMGDLQITMKVAQKTQKNLRFPVIFRL